MGEIMRRTAEKDSLNDNIENLENGIRHTKVDVKNYENNRININQLEQNYTDMCQRLNKNIITFEKRHGDHPKLVFELMEKTEETLNTARSLIDEVIKK